MLNRVLLELKNMFLYEIVKLKRYLDTIMAHNILGYFTGHDLIYIYYLKRFAVRTRFI